MSDRTGTQHGVFHKSKSSKGLPGDENMQNERGHVVAKVDPYILPCNAVSQLRHKKWHDCDSFTNPRLRDFHQ
jgi:hypothetical protein